MTAKPQAHSSQSPYLFVFLQIFSWEGGIQSYIKDIFRSYTNLPNQPSADVFLLRDGADCENPFASETFRFHYLKSASPALGRVRMAIALLSYLVRRRPQRVVCGHINLAPLVRMLCRPLGIPYSVIIYGKEVWFPLPETARKSLEDADDLWANSRYSRDRTLEKNRLEGKPVRFVTCVVDGDRFTPGAKSPELLKQYGLEGTRVLMTVARLWSGDIYKGVDVTLRALPKILQVFPDVKYLVIGRGDDQPRLANLAQELGVGDRVVFAGFVPTEALPDHYRLADAYIMPSQEGFGIVYLEAMACGVPVLSGDDDGSADPLQDGRVGWRVPHRDPDAVATSCIEILQGRELQDGQPREQRCNSAWLRQETLEKFSHAALTNQLAELLDIYSALR